MTGRIADLPDKFVKSPVIYFYMGTSDVCASYDTV
jgi:hypothetical protein